MSDPQPILERLQSLHPKLIDLELDRTQKLLGELGAPHLKMPPVVHVSGTNGKGSVIALMRAALEAAGYKVHVYTSPHLVRFNERIRVAGEIIDDEDLSEILEVCEKANKDRPITFFEITTVAAMVAFARTPADEDPRTEVFYCDEAGVTIGISRSSTREFWRGLPLNSWILGKGAIMPFGGVRWRRNPGGDSVARSR